ncbi:MAG: HAD hydrolase-like protein [Alphaproteobacteria bacterium]|nr:HAD hydrolase-like protein [Alphaproteobacteria bacterium]
MTVSAPLITFIDLDNLIIDTNKLFEDAHLEILNDVEKLYNVKGLESREERLRFVRDLDEAIIQHKNGAKAYDAKLLVRAVALHAGALRNERDVALASALDENVAEPWGLPATAVETIADKFNRYAFVDGIPELLPGVKEALERLHHDSDALVLITENKDTERCRRILEHYGLTHYFAERLLVGKKTTETYVELAKRYPAAPRFPHIMMGDQLDSDIAYAQQAGFITIFVPGGFRPNYEKAYSRLIKPDYQVATLLEAADIVRARRHSMARSLHLGTTDFPDNAAKPVDFKPF